MGLKTEIEQKEATNEPKLFVSWRGVVVMKLAHSKGYVVIHAPSVENVGNHLIGDLPASGWEVFTGSVTLTQD